MNQSDIYYLSMQLIQNPENWIKGQMAQDINKKRTATNSPDAKCFCTLGAIIKTVNEKYEWDFDVDFDNNIDSFLVALEITINDDYITKWNDEPERTHSEVIAALNKTRQRLLDIESNMINNGTAV